MVEKFKAFIGGKWIKSGSEGVLVNINPANTSEIVGEFPSCGKKEVLKAVASAKKAQKKWALVPAPKRGEIIKRAGDLMVKRKEEIAQLMTREMGKIIIETRGDVQEGIDTAYYMAGEGRRLFGDTRTVMAKTRVDTNTIQDPTGRSRTKDTRRPARLVATPMQGDTMTIFRMSSRNWRAEEAGLKRRA